MDKGILAGDILPKRIKVETVKEANEVKTGKGADSELETAPTGANMGWCLESALLDIAYERLGRRPETKKKTAISLVSARKRREW